MDGNVAPALFEALDGLRGHAQNLRHLALGFPKMPPNIRKLLLLHFRLSSMRAYSTTIPGTMDIARSFSKPHLKRASKIPNKIVDNECRVWMPYTTMWYLKSIIKIP